jgi:hypothetical protein
MKNVKFTFEGSEITFTFDTENKIMVNATEMAKVFNKDLFQFTKSEHAKSFIKSCLKPANAGFIGVKSEEDLIISKQNSGTYMHRVLALKFAAWLNNDFELWVYSTIDKILFGRLAEREESLKITTYLKNEKKQILDKEVYSGEDFERYLKIHDELRMEENKRRNLTRDCINEIQINIDFPF